MFVFVMCFKVLLLQYLLTTSVLTRTKRITRRILLNFGENCLAVKLFTLYSVFSNIDLKVPFLVLKVLIIHLTKKVSIEKGEDREVSTTDCSMHPFLLYIPFAQHICMYAYKYTHYLQFLICSQLLFLISTCVCVPMMRQREREELRAAAVAIHVRMYACTQPALSLIHI